MSISHFFYIVIIKSKECYDFFNYKTRPLLLSCHSYIQKRTFPQKSPLCHAAFYAAFFLLFRCSERYGHTTENTARSRNRRDSGLVKNGA